MRRGKKTHERSPYPAERKRGNFRVSREFVVSRTMGAAVTVGTPDRIRAVLERMESGHSENAACKAEGISRCAFRAGVLRVSVTEHFARAQEALALDQATRIEDVIDEMRQAVTDATPETAALLNAKINAARTEINSRQWFAAHLFKPTWGDSVQHQHAGSIDVNLHSWLVSATAEAQRLESPEVIEGEIVSEGDEALD